MLLLAWHWNTNSKTIKKTNMAIKIWVEGPLCQVCIGSKLQFMCCVSKMNLSDFTYKDCIKELINSF